MSLARHLPLNERMQQDRSHRRGELTLQRKVACELVGTFLLVFTGTGAAVLAEKFQMSGIGILGIALAFGFAALAGVYAFGPVSGGHLNPAVTAGLAASGRFPWRDVLPYWAAPGVGAIGGSAAVRAIANGAPGGYDASAAGLAANGYGIHSPGGFGLGAAFLTELLLTFLFVSVAIASLSNRAATAFAGIAIGLTLALTNLVAIPVTNAAINPARATGPALFVGGWALADLWLFWVAPLLGGLLAGALSYVLLERRPTEVRTETGAEHGHRAPLPAE